MDKRTWLSSIIATACAVAAFSYAHTNGALRQPAPRPKVSLAQVPLSFEVNEGQAAPDVKFVSRGPNHSVLLTAGYAVMRVGDPKSQAAVSMKLGDGHATIEPADQQPGQVNYLLGNDPSQWHIDVPHYARVRYREAYPGVDLVLYGNQQQLEYDLVVSPAVDPRSIAMTFDGAARMQINERGNLVLETASGTIEQAKPVAYQEIDGHRTTVDATYALKGDAAVGFDVGPYDTARPLVIDPTVLFFTTLGGGGSDEVKGMALDSTGNVYIAGKTTATNLPTTGALQGNSGGGVDGFVMKLGPGGSPVIYSTYIGGTGDDEVAAIAIAGRAGNACITGSTTSTNFPVFPAFLPIQRSNGGGVDAFVAQLNAAGNGLVSSSYLGGTGEDRATAIVVDSDNAMFVAGYTASNNFPTQSAFQPKFAGGAFDGFLAQIHPSGDILEFSTYIGGAGTDQVFGMAIRPEGGFPMITGVTDSPNFPITPGAFQPALAGASDAFITLFGGNGTPMFSSFVGGQGNDTGFGAAVGPNGLIGVIGETDSTNFPKKNSAQTMTSFPVPIAPQDVDYPALSNAFMVLALNETAPLLLYEQVFGGSGTDSGRSIAFDKNGYVGVGGFTNSADFPVVNPVQQSIPSSRHLAASAGADSDGFFGTLDPTQKVIFMSKYGGGGLDAVAVFLFGDPDTIYIGGPTLTIGGAIKGFWAEIRQPRPAPR